MGITSLASERLSTLQHEIHDLDRRVLGRCRRRPPRTTVPSSSSSNRRTTTRRNKCTRSATRRRIFFCDDDDALSTLEGWRVLLLIQTQFLLQKFKLQTIFLVVC